MMEDEVQDKDGKLRRWEEAPQESAFARVLGPGSSLATNLSPGAM